MSERAAGTSGDAVMIELDFEVPISKVNKVMDPIMNKGLFLRWVLYNEHRETVAVRAVVPEGELEETLFWISKSYGDALEITVVTDESGFKSIDQAFLNAVHLGDKTYPIVVLMQYGPETGPYLPAKITVITSAEFPVDSLSGVLRSRFGALGFDEDLPRKTVHRNALTRIVITP